MPYSEIRLSTHAFVPLNELVTDQNTIVASLTHESRYEPGLRISLSRTTETHFGYPLYMRNYALFTDNLIDERSPGSPISVSLRPGFRLRPNQQPLLEKFNAQLAMGRTGWLINMPTGAGKTVCACCMLQAIGRTTLVIVPRESLMSQWKDRIQEFTDIREDEIGTAQQDVCDFEGRKVVIGMIHSLAKDRYPEAFRKAFGLVIWDEVHVAAAQTFSQTLSLFAPRYRIGMSATLRRRDGLDVIYRWSIGEEILSIDRHTLVRPTVVMQAYRARKKNSALEYITDSQKRRGKLISELAGDRERNILLSSMIAAIARTGRRVVVFSERKQQLTELRKFLTGPDGTDPETVQLFTGETREEKRRTILAECQIILATYGVMSMGVDVPDLRAVVFATPQSGVAQSVGRILRICTGTLDPVVMDLVDTGYLDCTHWADSRMHYYTRTARAEIIELRAGDPLPPLD